MFVGGFFEMRILMCNLNIDSLLMKLLGQVKIDVLFLILNMLVIFEEWEDGVVMCVEIVQVMNMVLFEGLFECLVNGCVYMVEVIENGGLVYFDYGVLCMVCWLYMGVLLLGEVVFMCILCLFGFCLNGCYLFDKFGMMGCVYVYEDVLDEIVQFFVSELYLECFLKEFQQVVMNVVSLLCDLLLLVVVVLLWEVECEGWLLFEVVYVLLLEIVGVFVCQYDVLNEFDYEMLLMELVEMVWIVIEGNVFNYVIDCVVDVFKLFDDEKVKGWLMKLEVECLCLGCVFQMVYCVDIVECEFCICDGGMVKCNVLGLFYEFIMCKCMFDQVVWCWVIDLCFDVGNVQGIFKMMVNVVK